MAVYTLSLLTPKCSILPPFPPFLPSPSYLEHLSSLCVSKGTAVQSVQMLVCNIVLEEQNKDILMQIRWGLERRDNWQCVCVFVCCVCLYALVHVCVCVCVVRARVCGVCVCACVWCVWCVCICVLVCVSACVCVCVCVEHSHVYTCWHACLVSHSWECSLEKDEVFLKWVVDDKEIMMSQKELAAGKKEGSMEDARNLEYFRWGSLQHMTRHMFWWDV